MIKFSVVYERVNLHSNASVCLQNTRIKEGIYNINPNEEPLRSELLCGKFTVLVSTVSHEHNVWMCEHY